jgi:AcrR family transcriptional regulator
MATTTTGRPRDALIDDAVLAATRELLVRDGYLRLTIAGIAEAAGTTKPAIYRRWPTKAHLVHEAVFPARSEEVGSDGTLRDDVRALLRAGLDLLGGPAARAALPGLLAETAADSALAAEVLGRAAGGTFAWLERRLAAGVAAGDVRPDVSAASVFELAAGAAFIATATRAPALIDDEWIDATVDVIVRGIAAEGEG